MHNVLPIVEQWWRVFRERKENLQALKHVIKEKAKIMEIIGRKIPLPNQVIEPGMMFYNTFSPQEAQRHNLTAQPGEELFDENYWMQLHIAANYRAEKVYWNVDKELWESLQETKWPATVPAAALLYLPNRCFVINLPDQLPILVLYDLATSCPEGKTDWPEGGIELRIIGMVPNEKNLIASKFAPLGVLQILPGTLDQSLEEMVLTSHRAWDSIMRSSNQAKPGMQFPGDVMAYGVEIMRELIRGIVNVLLFAAGNEDRERIIPQWPTLANKVIRRHADDLTWKRDIRDGETYTLGTKFGSALRGYKAMEAVGEDDYRTPEGQRGKRPHVRSAHAHLFWTGPGRIIPKIRYLPPIAIKGASVPEEAERLTKRDVEHGEESPSLKSNH